MEMGTCSNRNTVLPEENKGASIPHIAWFYPGNIYSASKNSFSSSQANSNHGLDVPPIRSVAPTTEPAKNINSGSKSKPAKGKKQKTSVNDLSQVASKISKPKKPKKSPSVSKKMNGQSIPEVKREKKDSSIIIDTSTLDFSSIPSPVCSCTGVARVCYKWGTGGWQSSCCTISVSEYPLPMSSSRPGSRMAGRKMSNGAYGKLLLRLAAEGYDLNHPIDLKDHWARHGTNKFVTIK